MNNLGLDCKVHSLTLLSPPLPATHSLLISGLSVTTSAVSAPLSPRPATSPVLTGTLSGYLLRILADSTHRCSEGETGNKQEVRIKGMREASREPPLTLPNTAEPCLTECSICKIKHGIKAGRALSRQSSGCFLQHAATHLVKAGSSSFILAVVWLIKCQKIVKNVSLNVLFCPKSKYIPFYMLYNTEKQKLFN